MRLSPPRVTVFAPIDTTKSTENQLPETSGPDTRKPPPLGRRLPVIVLCSSCGLTRRDCPAKVAPFVYLRAFFVDFLAAFLAVFLAAFLTAFLAVVFLALADFFALPFFDGLGPPAATIAA